MQYDVANPIYVAADPDMAPMDIAEFATLLEEQMRADAKFVAELERERFKWALLFEFGLDPTAEVDEDVYRNELRNRGLDF